MSTRKQKKSGYGIHNVNKARITKKDIQLILDKKWKQISSQDLYKLYQRKWTTEKLEQHFKIKAFHILNRLRLDYDKNT